MQTGYPKAYGLGLGFALFCALFYICWNAVSGIYASWGTDEYSYAYLVPPLALWIGLHRLSGQNLAPHPTGLGFVPFTASLLFWGIGEVSGIPNLPQYGFLGLFYGLFLTLYGWPIVRRTGPALAYLFFAIPLPQALYLSLSAKMQLLSSDLGTLLLQLVGIPVFQDGNIIDLGNYKLHVVEACNGLRYLFPLASFGFLFAILLEDRMWKRVTIFLSTVPLAIFFNAFRIAVIGVVASKGSPEAAIQIVHTLEGWFVFFLCVALLYAETFLLLRIAPRGRFADRYLDLPQPPFLSGPLPLGKAPVLVIALILGLTTIASTAGLLKPPQEIIPPRQPFSALPLQIAGWTAQEEALEKETVDLLKATDLLSVRYKTADQPSIGLFIAYYESQRNERTFHAPSVCLPGSGWETTEADIRALPVTQATEAPALRYNRLIITKGADRQLIYYWFEQRGVSEPNFHAVKARIIWDSITKGRTDGALVRLATMIKPQEKEEDADARLLSFMKNSAPIVAPTVPDYALTKDKARP